MENCKSEPAKVTMRAMVLDVTPEEEAKETSTESETETIVAEAAIDPELVKAGENVFKKCKACHQVGEGAKNKSGPQLNGIVGKVAASVDGFKYSKVMRKAGEEGLKWTEEELAAFLTKPKAYMKGTKMSFGGLKKDEDKLAVIEYLKSQDN